jgi:type IV fimbrial biogenesis protein FimT
MLADEAGRNVLMPRLRRGFTLVEVLIALAVLGVLSVIGLPALMGSLNNSRVRSVAETLQNGLRRAQSEAILRSRQTAFVLTDAAPALSAVPAANGKNWYAQTLPLVASEAIDPTFFVQGGSFGSDTAGVTITGPTVICFNSIGRLVANPSTGLGTACTVPAGVPARYLYDVTRSGANRTLELQVSQSGQIRMCDKSRGGVSATKPDGC